MSTFEEDIQEMMDDIEASVNAEDYVAPNTELMVMLEGLLVKQAIIFDLEEDELDTFFEEIYSGKSFEELSDRTKRAILEAQAEEDDTYDDARS